MPAKKSYRLTKQKYLTDEEYDLLLKHMKRHSAKHPRDTSLILTAMYTGARISEILDIKFDDLFPPNQISIRGTKGSNDRELLLPPWLFDRLKSLPKTESGRLFDISYVRSNQIWVNWRAPITNKKFHSIRHTYAVRQYKRTRDFKLIQNALGHRQPANTFIYLDFVNSTEQMAKLQEE